MLERLEKQVYSRQSTALAAVSARTARLVEEYFGRRDVRVIRNGVDAKYFCPEERLARRGAARRARNYREGDVVLLLIGNDWRNKGLPAVIRAMAEIRDLPVRLLAVGSDDAGPFRAEAERLDLAEKCRWEAPREDVLELYGAADVYVSPSREDSFGLPVAEAMACGLPVISSSQAGVAQGIRDGEDGFVLGDPTDTKGLAKVLRRLASDAALRASMGNAARTTAAGWNWDEVAAAVWEMLKEAAEKRKASLSR